MRERKTIGLREVRALKLGETIWDAKIRGFNARRQKGPAVTYAVFYRTKEGRQRWHTIGRHGAWTPDTARDEARRILGDAARGGDPAGDKAEARKAALAFMLQHLVPIHYEVRTIAACRRPPVSRLVRLAGSLSAAAPKRHFPAERRWARIAGSTGLQCFWNALKTAGHFEMSDARRLIQP